MEVKRREKGGKKKGKDREKEGDSGKQSNLMQLYVYPLAY